LGLLTTITRANHTFAGWWTDPNGGNQVNQNTIVSTNMRLFARWTVTVTFNANGGTAANTTRQVFSGQNIGALHTIARANHTFAGWWTERTGGTQITPNHMITRHTTFFARWRATVTFNPTLGAVSPTTRDILTVAPIGPLPIPIGRNITFGGWWFNTVGGAQVTETTSVTASVTYFARWHAVITFIGGNQSNMPMRTVIAQLNSTLRNWANPTRPNYIFNGWWTQPNGGQRLTTQTLITENITFFARWTPIVRTVQFNPNGGEGGVLRRSVTINNPIGILPTPTRQGHTFAGWFTEAARSTNQINESSIITADVTFFARWRITVQFNPMGGTVTPNFIQMICRDERAAFPTPTRPNFRFEGWFRTPTERWQQNPSTLAESTILFARWTPLANVSTATVTFNTMGWGSNHTRQVVIGTPIGILPPAAASIRPNMSFGGWWTGQNGTGGQITPNTIITGNMTVFASWRVWIRFDGNGVRDPGAFFNVFLNRPLREISGLIDGVLPTLNREGYEFIGWHLNSLAGGLVNMNMLVSSSITLVAGWRPLTGSTQLPNRIVVFNRNGGIGNNLTIPVLNGRTLPFLPSSGTRDGHTFLGWFTSATGGTQIDTTTIITADITFFAQWRTNPPIIISPPIASPVENHNVEVNWVYNPEVNNLIQTIAVRDLTAPQTPLIIPQTTVASNNRSFTIRQDLLTAGHRYRIALSARVGNSHEGWRELEFSVREHFDHTSSAPNSFFVIQPTQNLDMRTSEVSNFNDTRARNNANYQSDLRQANNSLSQLHQAIYTGSYVLPFTNNNDSNFSQGFWGSFSHAGVIRQNHNSWGAIDIGTLGRQGLELYSMLDGTVTAIEMRNNGGSFVDIETSINGVIYVLRYLHVDHRGGFETPISLGIQVGHRVQRGARIGTVGGEPSWRTHIHIEVIRNGLRLDPLRFFDLEKQYRFGAY